MPIFTLTHSYFLPPGLKMKFLFFAPPTPPPGVPAQGDGCSTQFYFFCFLRITDYTFFKSLDVTVLKY